MATSKVTVVTDLLMTRIVSGEYKDVLPPQDVLSRNLCTSRTTVREAISKLEAWNVLTVRPKIGTKINPPNMWTLVNIGLVQYRLRAMGGVLSLEEIAKLVREIEASLHGEFADQQAATWGRDEVAV